MLDFVHRIPFLGEAISAAASAGAVAEVFAELLGLLLSGSALAAGGVALSYLLTLPGLRQMMYGFCFGVGQGASLLCVRWLGSSVEAIEDRVQDFLREVLVKGFMAGLDADDHQGNRR